VCLQLSLLAYNLGNLCGGLAALPKRIENWSLTSLQQPLRFLKTGGRLVKHARYYWLLLAEGPLTWRVFGAILRSIWDCPCGLDRKGRPGRKLADKEVGPRSNREIACAEALAALFRAGRGRTGLFLGQRSHSGWKNSRNLAQAEASRCKIAPTESQNGNSG
jgi:hypothetical protein